MEMILKRKLSFQNEKETSLLFDRPLLKQDIFDSLDVDFVCSSSAKTRRVRPEAGHSSSTALTNLKPSTEAPFLKL